MQAVSTPLWHDMYSSCEATNCHKHNYIDTLIAVMIAIATYILAVTIHNYDCDDPFSA